MLITPTTATKFLADYVPVWHYDGLWNGIFGLRLGWWAEVTAVLHGSLKNCYGVVIDPGWLFQLFEFFKTSSIVYN